MIKLTWKQILDLLFDNGKIFLKGHE